ncbi:MAG TPA: DarT ssDNA thymidine ADP-ribosyltransferase family protein [Ktedonobacteraceae bacterium]
MFTDGNVTIQQLAKYGTERVGIRPATANQPACNRQYSSGNPQGTNDNCSDIYSGSDLLRNLDWNGIANQYWGGDQEKIRIKHSEVLAPDMVPLAKIEGISTLTQEKANEVNALIKQYGLDGRIPGAIRKAELYF